MARADRFPNPPMFQQKINGFVKCRFIVAIIAKSESI
jgi:hypothetical protein